MRWVIAILKNSNRIVQSNTLLFIFYFIFNFERAWNIRIFFFFRYFSLLLDYFFFLNIVEEEQTSYTDYYIRSATFYLAVTYTYIRLLWSWTVGIQEEDRKKCNFKAAQIVICTSETHLKWLKSIYYFLHTHILHIHLVYTYIYIEQHT